MPDRLTKIFGYLLAYLLERDRSAMACYLSMLSDQELDDVPAICGQMTNECRDEQLRRKIRRGIESYTSRREAL